MIVVGGIFKSCARFYLSSFSFKHFKCSYLLAVLLFKYTNACNNVCQSNSSCNKKYTQQNFTFLSSLYQSDGVILSANALHNFSETIPHSLNQSLALIPIVSYLLTTHRNFSLADSDGHRNFSNYSSHTQRKQPSPTAVQQNPKEQHKKAITMADGPFSPGDPNSFSRPGKLINYLVFIGWRYSVICFLVLGPLLFFINIYYLGNFY